MAFYARALVAATTTGVALGAVLVTTPAGASTAPSAPAAVSPVSRIYVSLPRQGKAAPSAALIARGLRVAAKDHGGTAGGRRIKLVWLDDATGDTWDPAKVVANAQRAAADPTAIAYVGEGNSGATALSMPIVNRAGLAQLSPVSTATSLTSADRSAELQPTGVRTFFRPIPDDARQGTALVQYARSAGVTGGVLLVDDDSLYGRGLTTAFATGGARSGVGTIGRRVAPAGGAGLDDLAREVGRLKPRAVVYGGSPSTGAAAVVRAIHAASPATLIFGGEALANDAFAKEAGPAQSVLRVTAPAAHSDPRRTRTHGLGRRPAAFSVFAHNGMTALLRAVDRSAKGGAVTRERVRTAIFDGTLQSGLSGGWSITATGDSTYGVFDALRLSGGHVRTPGELAVDRLVRQEREAVRRRRAERTGTARSSVARMATRRTSAPFTPVKIQTITTAADLDAALIGMTDLELAMTAVQRDRAKLLDQQVQAQIMVVEGRKAQILRYDTLALRLRSILGIFPAGSAATRLTTNVNIPQTAIYNLRGAAADAASRVGWPGTLDTSTLGAVRDAIATTATKTDAERNAEQMEELRLQSLVNKRNEAFDVMTDFVRKMGTSSRAPIVLSTRP